MRESKEPLYSAELAGADFDKLKDFLGRFAAGKVERNKCKVPAADSDGGGLSGSWGRRPKGAVAKDGICEPSLPGLGGRSRCRHRRRLGRRVGGRVHRRAKHQVVVCEAERAIRRLSTVDALDILDDLQQLDGGEHRPSWEANLFGFHAG